MTVGSHACHLRCNCVCVCRLRGIYAKRTGKRDSSVGGEESQALGTPNNGHKRKRKVGGIEEDDDEDDDSNDQGEEEEDEEEDGGKKRKKTETCEEEVCRSILSQYICHGLRAVIIRLLSVSFQ